MHNSGSFLVSLVCYKERPRMIRIFFIILTISFGYIVQTSAKTTRGPITPNTVSDRCKKLIQTQTYPLPPVCLEIITTYEHEAIQPSISSEYKHIEVLESQPIHEPETEKTDNDNDKDIPTSENQPMEKKTKEPINNPADLMKKERYTVISQATASLAHIEEYLQDHPTLSESEQEEIEQLGQQIVSYISMLKNSTTIDEWLTAKEAIKPLLLKANEFSSL